MICADVTCVPQHTGSGDEGGGQSLTSSGSCLQDFLTHPFVECQGPLGTCHYFSNLYNFWLIRVDEQGFRITPEMMTLKGAAEQRDRISRCNVCLRAWSHCGVVTVHVEREKKKKLNERTQQFVMFHTEQVCAHFPYTLLHLILESSISVLYIQRFWTPCRIKKKIINQFVICSLSAGSTWKHKTLNPSLHSGLYLCSQTTTQSALHKYFHSPLFFVTLSVYYSLNLKLTWLGVFILLESAQYISAKYL